MHFYSFVAQTPLRTKHCELRGNFKRKCCHSQDAQLNIAADPLNVGDLLLGWDSDILFTEASVPALCSHCTHTHTLPIHRVWEETKLFKPVAWPVGWGIIWTEKVEGASSFPKFTLWQQKKNLERKQCCSVCGVAVCMCHWCRLGWQMIRKTC